VNGKILLILLVAFKRATMQFIKDGIDKAIDELRKDEHVELVGRGRPGERSSQAPTRSTM
jgi:hypothetical protein